MKIHLIERYDRCIYAKTACGLAISKESASRILSSLQNDSIPRFEYLVTEFEVGMSSEDIVSLLAESLAHAYTRGLLEHANKHANDESIRVKVLSASSEANIDAFKNHARQIFNKITYSDAPKP